MNSHSNQNEGIRVLEEFVCEAIPDPSVLASPLEPAVAGQQHELEVMVADFEPLSATLVGEDGRLKERIAIGSGVSLCPQFASLRRPGAVGGNEVLTFLIDIPVGIALNLVASALYDWMIKHGVRRARANGVELPISGGAAEDVRVIEQTLGTRGGVQ